jgi:hypothetical protein
MSALLAQIDGISDLGNGKDVIVHFAGGASLTFTGAGTGFVDQISDLVGDPNTQIHITSTAV